MIQVKNVTMHFDSIVALDSVNLCVPTGSAYGLLGSNGAGKSTLLRLLCGIYRTDNGSILVDGEETFDNVAVKSKLFFVNDETLQFTRYSLRGLARLYKPFYPDFSDALFENLIKVTGLPADRQLSTFSKGMKRQAVILVGIACMTPYLLLDEAFDGIDPSMRLIVKQLLRDSMEHRGLTPIISSHNLKEMSELCSEVALFHKGKILRHINLGQDSQQACRLQLVYDNDFIPSKDSLPSLAILSVHSLGHVHTLTVRGKRADILPVLEQTHPLLIDTLPLELEELFTQELEGEGYDYKHLL